MKESKDVWIVLIVLTCTVVLLPTAVQFLGAFYGSQLNTTTASEYGNFIAGMLSFVSIILLVVTLHSQNKSNYIEKFENKYFEMIKIHRENINEIGGRKFFVNLIREFRLIFKEILLFDKKSELNIEEIIDISYIVLFYGTGPNSSRELTSALEKYNGKLEIEILIKHFEHSSARLKANSRIKDYEAFGGHQSRLGHYYRHLYQSICYVDNQNDLSDDKKYDYVKILRAQLSNHEQAMLCVNALSSLGKNWNNNGLIEKYRLIKNLPKDFFDEENEFNLKDYYHLKFEFEEIE